MQRSAFSPTNVTTIHVGSGSSMNEQDSVTDDSYPGDSPVRKYGCR